MIFIQILVDRIVPGYPADRAEELEKEWDYKDPNGQGRTIPYFCY